MQRLNLANSNLQYVFIFSGIIIGALVGYYIGLNGVSKLLIAGLLGGAYLLLTINRPWIAVSIFFALVPMETLFVLQGSVTATLTKMAGAYLVFLVIITGSVKYLHDVFSSQKVLVMILFGGAAILSVMVSGQPSFSLSLLLTLWLSIILCFVLILMIRDTRTLYLATWALLLGGFFSIISPIFFQFGRATGYDLMRYGGLWGDQNEFAALLLVMIPLSVLNIIITRNRLYKIASIVISATITLGVILTYSRGAFLALCAMLILAIFKLSTGKNRIKILAVSIPCMILAFALIYHFFSEDIIARMETLKVLSSKESVVKDESLNLRYYFYFELTPKIFSEYPILGVGLRQIILHNPYRFYAHNTYFEVLTGTGLVGFIPFMLILYLTWKEIKTVERFKGDNSFYLRAYASALEIGFLGYLFTALFVSLDLNKMLWLTISIASVLFNLYRIQARAEYGSDNGFGYRGRYDDRRSVYLNR
ncbi:MAG: O-antigen ligase family protein [Thermodesulfobacteriota bacterium]